MLNQSVDRAQDITKGLNGIWRGRYGTVSCPVSSHGKGRGDRKHSLCVSDRHDGNIGVHCFANCDWRDVKEELRRRGLLSERWSYTAPKLPKRNVIQHKNENTQNHALALWKSAQAASGSLVENYLRHLGITIPPPSSIQFLEQHWHTESRQEWPTMVAAVQDVEGKICAIHRTYLTNNGSGKAPVPEKTGKKSLGRVGGGSVRLSLAADTVALVEGIEDALAVQQMTQTPTWAVLGASGFGTVVLPKHIRRVILAPDGDEAGDKTINPAARRLILAGIEVVVVRLPPGKDWCDILPIFEERAALLEFEGGKDHKDANREAWFETLGRQP
jgi:putative DNA primase/helicase